MTSPDPQSTSTTSQAVPAVPAVRPIKKANKPFLVHQKYKQEQRQAAVRMRTQTGTRPEAAPPGIVFQLLKWTVLAISTSLVLSKAITQTWTWGREPPHYLTSLDSFKHRVLPPPDLTLTEQQLAKHDGSQDTDLPIYLAIDGDVYDVTAGRDSYGPGGSYNIFAGRDAARAFVTGCFQTHLTHDLRGFNEKELATLKHWKEFYRNHAKYRRIGRVMHPPIDESSPIPEPCTKGKVGQPDSRQVKGN